jgi:GntR family transcriptional regulator/MocR family aminotransferase
LDLVLGIDPSSGAALHRQVYEALRTAILNGSLRAGARLPATRALAGQLSLSRSTVADAYDQLQAEGYIEGRHGSGTYVAPNLPEEVFHQAAQPVPPPDRLEHTLRLSSWGNRVVRADRSVSAEAREVKEYSYDFRPHRVAQDMFPWDAWRASVDRALAGNRDALFYAPAAGHPALRETIAEHVAKHRAVDCTPDRVVIVNGTQQGLNLLAELLLEAGEHVAVEDPGYPAARLALEARGLNVSRIAVDREGMDVQEFSERGPFRLVHVTPSHQDPTGATLSLARRLALLDEADRTDCVIVEDDYDSEFRYEGRPVESLQGLDRGDRVVYAGTFSKSVLAGLRIGFVILPRRLVHQFVVAKQAWDSGAPMLEQVALVEFMRSGAFERHIRRMRRLYHARRDALVDTLADVFGDRIQVGERHGGLNILVSLDSVHPPHVLARRGQAAGIGLRPVSSYYAHPPAQATFLMGFAALPESTIKDGVRLLAHVLDGNNHNEV